MHYTGDVHSDNCSLLW